MPRRSAKQAKRKSAHDDYELPKEVDFGKTKFIGFGLAALEKHAASRRKTVELDPDVAKDFADSADVNAALRLVQQLREVGTRRRRRTA